MNEGTARRSETGSATTVLLLLKRWYHIPVLAALLAFMLWTRTLAYDRFVREDGTIAVSGVDPWYHYRTTRFTVVNWPYTMPYEVWTGYPYGTHVDHFGTLFDLLIATAALVVGLGDPSLATVNAVFVLAPAVFGTLVAVPTYFIGKRLGGRLGGLSSVALLALFSGTFFRRSLVGFTDHHVAEALFMAIAVLAYVVALHAAEVHEPSYERVTSRDLDALRTPLVYSVLAGVAMALYVWTWPSAVLLVGVLGLFFTMQLTADVLVGDDPEHVAFVGVVSLTVAGLLVLPTTSVWSFAGATTRSLLQPTLAFGVALGCAFMAWLAREWEHRGIAAGFYPVAIAGIGLGAFGAMAVALPSLFDTLAVNLSRVVPIGATASTLTVSEAQPPADAVGYMSDEYGFAFFTAMAALAFMAGEYVLGRRRRAGHLLIVIWALFVTSMALTQVRFNYYLAVAVAACNARLIDLVFRIDRSIVPDVRTLRGVRVTLLVVVLLVFFVPLVSLVGPTAGATVVDRGQATGPSSDALTWEGSNEWLEENSPEPGAWGGADNADDLEYYGTYPIPEDRDFAYPEGSYGVMSWWDYGHLITVQAERIPHANPFQQNARSAAAFLTADSEERAELVLEALPAAGDRDDLTALDDDALAAIADERPARQEREEIRYVMIDDEMAGFKFGAITTYAGGGNGPYASYQQVETEDGETITAPARNDAYEDTMLSRLYYDDADGMEHYRLVHESDGTTRFASVAVSRNEGESWQSRQINRELTPQVERSIARFRANPDVEVAVYDEREAASVKTYERVEGAELTGSVDAPEGSTVTAELELTVEGTDRTFTYEQTARVENGEFTMTVPYATEQDRSVEEGYTDSSVAADGPYEISVEGERVGTAAVSESVIYDGGTGDLSLDGPATEDEDVNGDGDEPDDE
ncbi:oligosaccharyl transferase, archaeosortase A system-associated [Halalkalicoccus salilacus]|uniref:oligosaccharyl transferase, archaeosortase A system-associated n=1 Tax=Halalkalicoccus salilacus TaxID=3117459 RepID=UPI00300ED164